MTNASQVSSCGLRVAPPRTRMVAGSRLSVRSGGRTGLVIGGSLQCAAAPIRETKNPGPARARAPFRTPDLLALVLRGRKPVGSNPPRRYLVTPAAAAVKAPLSARRKADDLLYSCHTGEGRCLWLD